MKKQLPLLTIVLLALAAYAVLAASKALHHGNLMLFIVLICIAVILWTRSHGKPQR